MNQELHQLFGPMMVPKTHQAKKLMEDFSRWIVAQLHEMGCNTIGLGPIDPKWRLFKFDYGRHMLQRSLSKTELSYMIARTFFYGRPKTNADAYLCQLMALLAEQHGLIGAFYANRTTNPVIR